jgi:protein-disulfide isomerase
MGPADAPVVLLLAVDYGSPFMEQSASIWPTLVAGAAGRLRVDLLHAPIPGRHPGAEFAARAVLAAPSEKAWALHQRLLNDHKGLSPPKLIEAFREVGLDPAATKKALDQPGIGDALNGERAIVEARGVRASPTVFVNGYRARGLRDAADYQAMIDRELGKLK